MHIITLSCILLCLYSRVVICSVSEVWNLIERISGGTEDILEIILNDEAKFRRVIHSSYPQRAGIMPLLVEALVLKKGNVHGNLSGQDIQKMMEQVLGSSHSIDTLGRYTSKHNCIEELTRFIFKHSMFIPVPESYDMFNKLLRILFSNFPGFVRFEIPEFCEKYDGYDQFIAKMASNLTLVFRGKDKADVKRRVIHDCLAYEVFTHKPNHIYAEACIKYAVCEDGLLSTMLILSKQLELFLASSECNDCTSIWAILNQEFIYIFNDNGKISELNSMLSSSPNLSEIIKQTRSLKIELYLKHYQSIDAGKYSLYRDAMIGSCYFERYFDEIWNVATATGCADTLLSSLFAWQATNNKFLTFATFYPPVSKLSSVQLSRYLGESPPSIFTLRSVRSWFYKSWSREKSALLNYLSPPSSPYSKDAFSAIKPLEEKESFIHLLTSDCMKRIFLEASRADFDFLNIYLKFPLVCKAWKAAASSVQLSDILHYSKMATFLYMYDGCILPHLNAHKVWPWSLHESPCNISTLSLHNLPDTLNYNIHDCIKYKIFFKLKHETPELFLGNCKSFFGSVICIDFPECFDDQQNADILLKLFTDKSCTLNFHYCKRPLYVLDRLYFGIINKIADFNEKKELFSLICDSYYSNSPLDFYQLLICSHHQERYSSDTIKYFLNYCDIFEAKPYCESMHSSIDSYFMDLFCLQPERMFMGMSTRREKLWFFKMILKALKEGRSLNATIKNQVYLLDITKSLVQNRDDIEDFNSIIKLLKSVSFTDADPDFFELGIISALMEDSSK